MLQAATKSTTVCSVATFKQWLNITSNKSQTITALTSAGLVASATCVGHGYQTGTCVVIAGVATSGYNGEYLITVVDADHFTFPLAAAASSPASGTMSVTVDDGRYALMADGVTDEWENETNAFIVKRQLVETFDGDGKIRHVLNHNPVVTIDSLTIGGAAVDASAYSIDKDTGIITLLSGSFTCGLANCVITYTTGYDVQDGPALPSDVVRALLDLAKAVRDELVSNAIAASSVSIGPASMVIKASKRPQSVQRIFDAWEGKGFRP